MIPATVFAGFKAAMLTVVPTSAPPSAMPSVFEAVTGLEGFAASGKQRAFTVANVRSKGAEAIQVTGTTGIGLWWLRVQVLVKHLNTGASIADFEAFLAEEHRRILDQVLGYFRDNKVAGVNSIMDEGVSLLDDVLSAEKPTPEFVSVFQFRVVYRDTIAYTP